MADYKDIIAGTLSKLIVKAKDVAEAASEVVNENRAEGVGVREIYEQGANTAKTYARIAKLALEINGDSEELKRVYAEIGRLCYDDNKTAPDGMYAPLFAQVAAITQSINDKRQEIEDMKAEHEARRGGIDVEVGEFENVVDATESDGTAELKSEPEQEEQK